MKSTVLVLPALFSNRVRNPARFLTLLLKKAGNTRAVDFKTMVVDHLKSLP